MYVYLQRNVIFLVSYVRTKNDILIVTFGCVKYNSYEHYQKMSFAEQPSMENCPQVVLDLISDMIDDHLVEHINYSVIEFIDMERFRSFLTEKFVGVLADWKTGFDGEVPSYSDRSETVSEIPMWFQNFDGINKHAY